jgi:hypothetical protein
MGSNTREVADINFLSKLKKCLFRNHWKIVLTLFWAAATFTSAPLGPP